MYIKRQAISKDWPIPRKGTKYLIRASHNQQNGIPILIILRDILKIAKNRKEVKKILNSKLVSLNGRIIKKENLTVFPFDIVKIKDKTYELGFSDKGKFEARECKRAELISKVVGKKILKKKKTQLNLLYGKNSLSEEKINIGDSVVFDKGKIVKVIKLEEGKEAIVFSGKYKGEVGKIEKIENKIASISAKNGKINVPVENIMVLK